MNNGCPVQAYLEEQARPRWWCLQSKATGKLILEDLEPETGEPIGSVLVYWDRDEAEAAAVAHRETYPGWLIEVVPLPSTPPSVVRPKPSDFDRIIAIQTAISLGDQLMQIEMRPRTGDECTRILQIIGNALRAAAEQEPAARMAPITFVKIGKHLSKQADTVNKVA